MQINLKSALFTKPIAHRGMWLDLIENSMPAYQKAVDLGYPIEIDLYSSTDGVLYCFHDKKLDRMTGKSGFIFEQTSEFLNALTLKDTDLKIPKLTDVLKLCENKIPLLIEIKNQPDKKIVERVLKCLKDYKGEYAIQSFNPLYINKVKKLAPNVLRGILSTSDYEDLKDENPLIRKIIKNMSLNFLVKPHFISVKHTAFPLKKGKIKNKAILSWTITDQTTYDRIKPFVNNVIFENFIPRF